MEKIVNGKVVKMSGIEEKEVLDERLKTKTAEDAIAWKRNRASAYPSVGDQLDMMMKDKRDGTTTHQTACEAVKTQFPKG
jgi:uncharacterized protein with PhoU and TrkA domain